MLLLAPHPIHLNLADATYAGAVKGTEIPGYHGSGYATGFQKDTDKVTLKFNAEPGIYQVTLRYCAPNGPKGYGLRVNGADTSGMFEATDKTWHTTDGGKIELKEGENTLEVLNGWGWYDLDAIDLTPAKFSALKAPPAKLSDPNASPIAAKLYRRLLNDYGKRMLSGQYDKADNDYVAKQTGQIPAIFGSDFIDFSSSRQAHGAKPTGVVEDALKRARQGQVLTFSWHWNAPDHLIDGVIKDVDGKPKEARWWSGFYTYATTFDLKETLDHPEGHDYQLLLSDMDIIAAQLEKFQQAGIPILWRPLHEADGGWFWWGAKGPESFKKLWRLMYNRFTQVHHLHNLIWVLSAPNKDWYPGDDVVDVYGVDAYPSDPSDPQSATWDSLQTWLNGRKPLALTEFGMVPDADRAFRFGAKWLYFVSWTDKLGARGLSVKDLKRRYTEKSIFNLASF